MDEDHVTLNSLNERRARISMGRRAVASGARPSLVQALKKVLGSDMATVDEVCHRVAAQGWTPNAKDPRTHIAHVLSTLSRPNDPTRIFDRGARGQYRVMCVLENMNQGGRPMVASVSDINRPDLTSNGQSKIERYDWKRVTGEEGRFEKISKHRLTVDSSYQRDIEPDTIQKITQEFSWSMFGTLIVFESPDGAKHIVDGQHRRESAMRRSDVDMLPCLVFTSRGAAEEAKVFIAINTGRRGVPAVAKHKAARTAGDPIAVEIDALITKAGRTAGKAAGAGTVRCVARLRDLVVSSRNELYRIWPLVIKVCEGDQIHDTVLAGLVYLEHNLMGGVSLSDKRWAPIIIKIGAKELQTAASREAQLYAKGGAKVWAIGMMKRINKGMKYKLSLRSLESE